MAGRLEGSSVFRAKCRLSGTRVAFRSHTLRNTVASTTASCMCMPCLDTVSLARYAWACVQTSSFGRCGPDSWELVNFGGPCFVLPLFCSLRGLDQQQGGFSGLRGFSKRHSAVSRQAADKRRYEILQAVCGRDLSKCRRRICFSDFGRHSDAFVYSTGRR